MATLSSGRLASVPLVALLSIGFIGLAVHGAYQTQTSSQTTSSITTTTIRLKANRLRRPESCRESLPRKSEDLPALVITGRVKEVDLANEQQQPTSGGLATNQAAPPPVLFGTGLDSTSGGGGGSNKALVNIQRVIKGNKQLLGGDIIVSGFNLSSSQPCPNYVKPNDTLILLLEHEADRRYTIQGANLLSMNLNNLDRINAIAADEPYKRRAPIEDILCEAHYCAYGRCQANDRGQLSCACPEMCPPTPGPVCGSDNATYPNECHLIKEGCRRQKPLFVTKEGSC